MKYVYLVKTKCLTSQYDWISRIFTSKAKAEQWLEEWNSWDKENNCESFILKEPVY